MRVGNDGENEFVQIAEDLLIVFEIEANVEGFDPGEIFEQIEITIEKRRLGVFQSAQLRYDKHEDVLQVKGVHVRSLGGVNSEDKKTIINREHHVWETSRRFPLSQPNDRCVKNE